MTTGLKPSTEEEESKRKRGAKGKREDGREGGKGRERTVSKLHFNKAVPQKRICSSIFQIIET